MSSPLPLRPTHALVNLDRLAENYRAIRQKTAPAKIMPVVKANAYGHGILEVARLMERLGADYLGVATAEEGFLLRQNGISAPVLVLGGILTEQVPAMLLYDLTLTASSTEKLAQFEAAAAQVGVTARVHLKIDTGMERVGVREYEAEPFLEASLGLRHVQVEGIYSHFANSDAADLAHARLQLERFEEVLRFYERRSLPLPLRHIANSGAILQLPEAVYDLVRPGILLYGVYPSPEAQRTVAVRPALTWKTQASFSKVTLPGRPVGYGSTWQSDHPVRLLTAPVGYGDGYFRALGNRGAALVRGRRCALAGRVSMDQLTINVEDADCAAGEEIVLLGEMGEEQITAQEMADWAGTIAYEILTNISGRVPRVFICAPRPG
ncbi:MAG: alanine racemase [Chloroflexi bacterium]|nr:alanine racemase [Chloroflexota bacterium]